MSKPVRAYLVDDNDIDLIVNDKLLRISNITEDIRKFNSGEEFLQSLKDLKDCDQYLNVLLLDIMMPGMTGFETAEVLFREFPKQAACFQVYVLSSSIDRHDIQRAQAIPGVRRVLEKPLDTYLLKGLLKEMGG
ncbi:MAG: two-component system response regulator [Flavobacteriales bacterium]|jgi:CheY-like chemotaxis protein